MKGNTATIATNIESQCVPSFSFCRSVSELRNVQFWGQRTRRIKSGQNQQKKKEKIQQTARRTMNIFNYFALPNFLQERKLLVCRRLHRRQ